jgi:hypothetical protein
MLAPGDRGSPTRASLGTASLSISNLFVFSSTAKPDNPVRLPPGRPTGNQTRTHGVRRVRHHDGDYSASVLGR